MSEPKYRDEEWLREQYVEKERTLRDIAEECACSWNTVGRWLKKRDIETRRGGKHPTPKQLKDERWLREQYVEKERAMSDIAEECECSSRTVRKWLLKHDIETRSIGPRPISQQLNDKGWLREQYIEKKKTSYDIAEECNRSHQTVLRWLRKHDIETRSQYPSGRDHPHWNGGVFPYGSGWNEAKRREVRERDGYECVDCGTTQDEHKAEQGEKLHVHHLLKARNVDDPEERNAAENLVTLCRDCHRKWERVSEAGIKPQLEAF